MSHTELIVIFLTLAPPLFLLLFFFLPLSFLSLSASEIPLIWSTNRGSALPVRVYQSGRDHHPATQSHHHWHTQTSQLQLQSFTCVHANAHILYVTYDFFFTQFGNLHMSKCFYSCGWCCSLYLPCHDCNFSCLWINLAALKRCPLRFHLKTENTVYQHNTLRPNFST